MRHCLCLAQTTAFLGGLLCSALAVQAAPLDLAGELIQGAQAETGALVLDLPLAPDANEIIVEPGFTQSTAVIEELRAPSGESVGLTDDTRFGLGENLWGGLNAPELHTTFQRLPARIISPALHNLALYLLTRMAYFPEMPKDPEAPDAPKLLIARVQKLAEMGQLEQAISLAELSPHFPATHLQSLRRDLRALEDRVSEACTISRDSVREWKTTEWQRAALVCDALDGHADAARMKWEMLKENATPELWAILQTLDSALADTTQGAPLEDLTNLTPLEVLYLVGTKHMTPTETAFHTASLPVLRYLGTASAVQPAIRIQAAELAASAHALTPKELEVAYKALPLTSSLGSTKEAGSDPAHIARTLALESNPFKRRAWLFQSLQQAGDDATKAELIDTLWRTRPLPLSFRLQEILAPIAVDILPDHVNEKTRARVAPSFVQILALEKTVPHTLLPWLQDVPQTSPLRPLVSLKIQYMEKPIQSPDKTSELLVLDASHTQNNQAEGARTFFDSCPKAPGGLTGAELLFFWGASWPLEVQDSSSVLNCLDRTLPELSPALLGELLGTAKDA